jgi:hypothetical protein
MIGCPDSLRKGVFAQQHYVFGRQPMLPGDDTRRKSETELTHVLSPDFIMKSEMVLAIPN